MLAGCGVKAQLKRADKKYAIGEYYEAAEEYKKAYQKLNPQRDKALKAEVAFKQGECYRLINNTKAATSYKNAIRYRYGQKDSIVYLRQAQVLHYQGNYREAEKGYRLYLQGNDSSYVAQAGIYACQNVTEWKKEKTRYKIRLAKELNGKRCSTIAPMFIGNNPDALMITSNRQGQGADKKAKQRVSKITGFATFNLFQTRKDSKGKWETPELAEGLYDEPEEAETEQPNDSTGGSQKTGQRELGICTFNEDGSTMYFTYSFPQNGKDLGAKIYSSSRASGQWAEPTEVKLFADSSITVAHPALNRTGDTLYFATDAPGGKGGKDIWYAVQENGEWLPYPMEGNINTEGDEMYPYVHRNGTLYFASNGHPGYGGLDLYYVDAAGDVYNMGAPFNTNGDDFGITFAGETQNGFFTSNRGQRKAIDQLYEFILPELEFLVTGKVIDPNGEPVSDAMIRLVGNDGTNTKLPARRDGTYTIKINRDARYVMLAGARGYLNVSAAFETIGLKDSKTEEQDFVLQPISKPVKMNNVFYEFGKWELTKETEKNLGSLVKLLNDNPHITIELSAHTDRVGNDAYNLDLSQKRAQAVVDFLIKQGIEKERLTAVGYGETQPVVVDEAIAKQYKLPLGQVLDDAYISTLSENEQEVCNQINRRTEFRVLKTTYNLY